MCIYDLFRIGIEITWVRKSLFFFTLQGFIFQKIYSRWSCARINSDKCCCLYTMEGCRQFVYGEEFYGRLFIAFLFLTDATLELFIPIIVTSQISVDHILSGRLHTLITSAFSHRDAIHLFSNMIGLYFFGTSVRWIKCLSLFDSVLSSSELFYTNVLVFIAQIAQTFGPQYLLKLYLAGALTGSIFYLLYQAFIAPSIYRVRLSNSFKFVVFLQWM